MLGRLKYHASNYVNAYPPGRWQFLPVKGHYIFVNVKSSGAFVSSLLN